MTIIDTHSHVNFNAYKEDRDEVMKRTLAENVFMINVGTQFETSQSAIELAEKYSEGVFASIGLHPMYAGAEFLKLKNDANESEALSAEIDFATENYRALAQSKKVVAIGEVGLDYYYKPKGAEKLKQFKEKQKSVFLKQLNLANELNLPLIIHCRVAHTDLIEILKSNNVIAKGTIHCFTGSVEEMKQYIELGFYIGINGIIFKLPLDEAVKQCPLDKMVLETDCPYLTPGPEGQKRNEPLFIKHTIQKIADLKGVSFEEVAAATTENAKKLFKI